MIKFCLNYMTLLQVQNAGDNAILCHIHYLIFSDKHIHEAYACTFIEKETMREKKRTIAVTV